MTKPAVRHGAMTGKLISIIPSEFSGKVFNCRELFDRLSEDIPDIQYNSIQATLSKWTRDGYLARMTRGEYAATLRFEDLTKLSPESTSGPKPEPDRKLSYDEIGRGVSRLITRLEMENAQLVDDLAACQKQRNKLQAKCNEMLQNSDLNLKDIT